MARRRAGKRAIPSVPTALIRRRSRVGDAPGASRVSTSRAPSSGIEQLQRALPHRAPQLGRRSQDSCLLLACRRFPSAAASTSCNADQPVRLLRGVSVPRLPRRFARVLRGKHVIPSSSASVSRPEVENELDGTDRQAATADQAYQLHAGSHVVADHRGATDHVEGAC